MLSLDYTFYTDEYKGSNSEDTFNALLERARYTVDSQVTVNTLKVEDADVDEYELRAYRFCLCEVIDTLNSMMNADGSMSLGIKASESVGPWSVNYSSNSLPTSTNKVIRNICSKYLVKTSFMCMWC